MISLVHPPGYPQERAYIFDVVFNEFLSIEYRAREAATTAVEVTLDGDTSGRKLIVPDTLFATPPARWLTPASCPRLPLKEIRFPGVKGTNWHIRSPLPILFGDILEPWRRRRLEIPIDIFGSAFFLLTRYEEYVSPDIDDYGRFPASHSILCRAGVSNRPIVDEYVELLWRVMHNCWPRLRRKCRKIALHITHDVDFPLWNRNRSLRALLAASARDIIIRRDLELAFRRRRSFKDARWGDYLEDPYNTFKFLMEESEQIGVKSAFYLKGGVTSLVNESWYSLNGPWMRSLIRNIGERGHEVGVHPSLRSFDHYEAISREFQTVRRACEESGIRQSVWGGRQHCLRWANPITWQCWEDAGLQYDSTLGFREAIGFRCGTSHEYPCFDLKRRQRLRLRERPLIVMDTAMDSRMHLRGQELIDATLSLAATCKRFRGEFTLLWHNSNLLTRASKDTYYTIIWALSEMFGTAG